MRIDISVEISDARQWLLLLKSTLEQDGHQVFFRIWGDERRASASMSALKALEIAFFGAGRGLWKRGNLDRIAPLARDDKADLLIELSRETSDQHVLALFLDGKPGLREASSALLARHIPYVEIRSGTGALMASGLPAIESPEVIVHAMDGYYARLVTLIRQAVLRQSRAENAASVGMRSSGAPPEPVLFGLKTLGNRIKNRLTGNKGLDEHWRIGLRQRLSTLPLEGDSLVEGFHWLPDDGQRFYADPILFEHEERHFLFMEEYPFATRKGIISVTELGEDGHALYTPRKVLECEKHLSYPFMFRHGGKIYMMPENSQQRRLPLFRATNFPFEWTFERNLIDNIDLSDATLFERDGSFWLFGTTREQGASSWDCLSLFHSPSIFGPYTPLCDNPVVIDARYARPAGPILHLGDKLIRPVQNCLGGYGRFIRFLEVTSLGRNGLAQRECGRLLSPMGSEISGVHSYCVDNRFEAIDACTRKSG